jgi:hypothetical protein
MESLAFGSTTVFGEAGFGGILFRLGASGDAACHDMTASP